MSAREPVDSESPEETGVAATDADDAHIEAAHLLANDARGELRAAGLDDDEIRRWSEAYLESQESGGRDQFIAWVKAEQHH